MSGVIRIPKLVTSGGGSGGGSDKEIALIERTITGAYSIPEGTTKIGIRGLSNMTGIEKLNIPSSVTSLENYALYNMIGLKSLTIPYSVTSLGNYSCAYLTGLEELIYDANIPINSYNSGSDKCIFSKSKGKFIIGENTPCVPDYLLDCGSSSYYPVFSAFMTERNKDLTIGYDLHGGISLPDLKKIWLDCKDSSITLKQKCFCSITGLTKLYLNAKNIKYYSSSSTDFFASSGYTNGITVKFGENTKQIHGYLFNDDAYLKNVYMPSSITYIGANTFDSRKYTKLTGITIDKAEPPTLAATNAFTNTNNCPIYVPAESVAAYQGATNWSTYSSRITALTYTNYSDGTNTLSLGNNLWFDLVVGGVAYNGTYTLTDGALSLEVFAKDDDSVFSGTITDNVLTITINGVTYTLTLEA